MRDDHGKDPTRDEQLWAQNPLFATLGSQRCSALAEAYEASPRETGAELLSEGEAVDHVIVVLAGSVRIFQRAADGREVLVKLLRAPCLLGDLELLAGVPMVKNVAVVQRARVAEIPAATFVELLQSSTEAMMVHLQQLASAFCVAARHQRQVFASVEQRLANLLLSYADFYGETDGDEVLIGEALSQNQMALSVGTARRSVAKVLSDWGQKGYVSRRGERYRVHRVDKLEELAASIRGSLNYEMGMSLEQVTTAELLSRGVVEVLSGEASLVGQRYDVDDELTVGQRASCRLILFDAAVAEVHCRIHRGSTGARFWVEDLASESGTRVNGKAVGRAVLRDGDVVEVGATRLRFALES